MCAESRRQRGAARACVVDIWQCRGPGASWWVEAQGTVCIICVCVCVCWDEFITKLKDLMRRAEGQRQKEVPALAQ